MKRIFITAILLVVTALAFAQNNGADKILGVYLSENKTGKVQITQKDGKYIGTLVWTSIENAKDEKNPDAALRSRTLKGTIILKDMVFVDGIWKNGTIYDPESGNTYKATSVCRPSEETTSGPAAETDEIIEMTRSDVQQSSRHRSCRICYLNRLQFFC